MSEPMMWLLVRGVWETLAMTFVSGFFGFDGNHYESVRGYSGQEG